jgi:hypothetical protein
LRGIEDEPEKRHILAKREEEAFSSVSSGLVSYVAPADNAALAYERDGLVATSWTRQGALRLAELLPPACSELANMLRQHFDT